MKTTDPADLRRLADLINWRDILYGLDADTMEQIRLALESAADEIQGFRTGKCPQCKRSISWRHHDGGWSWICDKCRGPMVG